MRALVGGVFAAGKLDQFSDWIESLHDGSWFGGEFAKLGVFLPAAAVLLGLWVTGVYLFFMPVLKKRANRKSRALRSVASSRP